MNIMRLELLVADLQAQRDFYVGVLELPVKVQAEANGKRWEVHGVPYEIIR